MSVKELTKCMNQANSPIVRAEGWLCQ